MIVGGACAFLTADLGFAGIEKISEELPAGRRLIAIQAKLQGHAVHCARNGHRARQTFQARFVGGRERGIGGQGCQAVGRGHIHAAAQDHVAIPIAVRGRTEIGRVAAGHDRH